MTVGSVVGVDGLKTDVVEDGSPASVDDDEADCLFFTSCTSPTTRLDHSTRARAIEAFIMSSRASSRVMESKG